VSPSNLRRRRIIITVCIKRSESKDQITVTGSRVIIDGKPAIIAAGDQKGGGRTEIARH
jgi:hypothetical protein